MTRFRGAISALVLLLAAVGVSAAAQNGAAQQNRALNAQIQTYLTQQFSKNKLTNVRAHVEDQVATLTGTVPNYRDWLQARHLAQQVSSLNGVIMHVRVTSAPVPDAKLRDTIAQRLTYDRMGMGQIFNALTVEVKNDVVTVGGEVASYPDRDSALDIIADTKGVRGVVDHITVAPTSLFDDQIRYEAARRIYGNPALQRYRLNPAHPIRIVVNNGHITLEGVVASQVDKQVAGAAVSGIPGVFSVKNDLVVAK